MKRPPEPLPTKVSLVALADAAFGAKIALQSLVDRATLLEAEIPSPQAKAIFRAVVKEAEYALVPFKAV
jgi:hypothetical protein